MYDLFRRLETPRKRVMAERQIMILNRLLEAGQVEFAQFAKEILPFYHGLKNPIKAANRDLTNLYALETIGYARVDSSRVLIWADLEWPTRMTESEFFTRVKAFPSAKSTRFLE